MSEARRIGRRYRLRWGGLMYVVVTGIVGTAAINSQTNLLFWTFGLMVGALLVSLVVGRSMLRGLSLRRIVPDHGCVDEPLPLSYELHNRNGRLAALALTLTERDGWRGGRMRGPVCGWVAQSPPRTTVQAEALGWPALRGTVALDRVEVKTTLPFGIVTHSVTFSQPAQTVVWPRLVHLNRMVLNALQQGHPVGARSAGEAGGNEDFYGLREYRHGDSLKQLDWKRSARTGELLSRELMRPRPPRLMVLMDVRRETVVHDEQGEAAITLTASVLCHALRTGYEAGLVVCGAPCALFTLGHGPVHQARMLEALGKLDLEDAPPPMPPLPHTPGARWLVVHAGATDPSLGPREATRWEATEMLAQLEGKVGAAQSVGPSRPTLDHAPALKAATP